MASAVEGYTPPVSYLLAMAFWGEASAWLSDLPLSPDARSFAERRHSQIKEDFHRGCHGTTCEVAASESLFKVAVEHASLVVIQELLLMYLRGELHATHRCRGRLDTNHSRSSSKTLQLLVQAGVFTDNGQERSHIREQRGYVGATFMVPRSALAEDVLAMLTATESCFAACIQGTYYLHTYGVDGMRDMVISSSRAFDKLATGITVTTEKGEHKTCVGVDNDDWQYCLGQHKPGQPVSFKLWDPMAHCR